MTNSNEADVRWRGITRPYSSTDVERVRGSLRIEHTLARRGAEKLWQLLQNEDCVAALGALTGNQAMQQVKAGLKAIYVSGWQVAADANLAGQMYSDQSLYPANSVPALVRRINQALQRADQIYHAEGNADIDWFAPIVADGEAGFGGPLNVFELTKAMLEAGAAGVHFEDQLASEKKCGHMGGKVLVPTLTAIKHLIAARLAADVCDVPMILIARTDANAAALLTNDVDERDREFLTGERTPEGFFRVRAGLDQAIARAQSYAPFAELIWCETSEPNLVEAKRFAENMRYCRRRNSRPNAMDIRRRNISAKSAQVTLISSRKSSPTVRARPRPWTARSKRSSSVDCKIDDRQRKCCARLFRADQQSSRRVLRRNRARSFFRLRNAFQRHHLACA